MSPPEAPARSGETTMSHDAQDRPCQFCGRIPAAASRASTEGVASADERPFFPCICSGYGDTPGPEAARLRNALERIFAIVDVTDEEAEDTDLDEAIAKLAQITIIACEALEPAR